MKNYIYNKAQDIAKIKIIESEYKAQVFSDYVLDNNPSPIGFNDDNLYDDFIIERLH